MIHAGDIEQQRRQVGHRADSIDGNPWCRHIIRKRDGSSSQRALLDVYAHSLKLLDLTVRSWPIAALR
jgi:hypothetical protein